ncbi:MAG: hypothetical protein ACM3WQ_03030 [Chloroflexota bacterium]
MSKTIEEIADIVKQSASMNRDITIPNGQFSLNFNGTDTSWLVGGERFKSTKWANSQIFSKLGMPSRYFNDLLVEDPELATYHTNRVLSQSAPEEWFVRTKVGVLDNVVDEETSGEGDKEPVPFIRGVMSDKYSVLDNDKIVMAVSRILSHYVKELNIQSYCLEDHRMHIRITLPQTAKDFGLTTRSKNDILQVGLDIINSEVAYHAMNITGFIWRLVCTNGMRRMEKGDTFTQRHIFLDDNTFFTKCCFAIRDSVESGLKTMEQFVALKQLSLQHPLQLHEVIGKELEFTNSIVDSAKEYWEEDATAYGIINSFTAAARNLDNEKRLEVERQAGKMLMIPAKTWHRYDVIAGEITE